MEFEKEIENAIIWAKNRLNSKDYLMRCLAFVEDDYERSNEIEMWGGADAQESAELYEAHKHVGLPPKGKLLYFIHVLVWSKVK